VNPARNAKARALNRRWRLSPSHPRQRPSVRATAWREAEHQPALAPPVDSWLTAARMVAGNFAAGPDWVVTTDDPAAAAVARRVLGGTGS
jgi:hypothetical protein